jgi:phospholipid transport system substrate-binding protein
MTTVNLRGGWRWLAIVGMVLGTVSGAQAGPVTDQLRDDLARVFRVIEETSVERAGANGIDVGKRREAIRRVAAPVFDWREMTSRTLGQHWQARSEAERTEFVQIFSDLVNRAYITQLERYSGEAIRYISERIEGDLGGVSTRFVTKQGREIPVDYRVISRDGRWRIYDVVVQGVSLVSNYRSQFDKVIRSSSYPELVKRIRDMDVAAR